jgi:hypothetical protein
LKDRRNGIRYSKRIHAVGGYIRVYRLHGKNEINHSAKILNDLIKVLIEGLSPLMEIVEVEGDAVFAHAPAAKITRGELLLPKIIPMRWSREENI